MNTEQCNGCKYWQFLSGLNCNACHYLVDTGKLRERNGDICLSRKKGGRKRGSWDMPTTYASTYAGYKMAGQEIH